MPNVFLLNTMHNVVDLESNLETKENITKLPNKPSVSFRIIKKIVKRLLPTNISSGEVVCYFFSFHLVKPIRMSPFICALEYLLH